MELLFRITYSEEDRDCRYKPFLYRRKRNFSSCFYFNLFIYVIYLFIYFKRSQRRRDENIELRWRKGIEDKNYGL